MKRDINARIICSDEDSPDYDNKYYVDIAVECSISNDREYYGSTSYQRPTEVYIDDWRIIGYDGDEPTDGSWIESEIENFIDDYDFFEN